MKTFTINPNHQKQIARILILSFSIFCIIFSQSYSQVLTITSNSWNNELCQGDIETYIIVNCTTGIIYDWYVYPPTAASIKKISPCEAEVQWLVGADPAAHNLYVTDGINQGYLIVEVYDIPEPYITFDNQVECQATILRDDGLGNTILDDGEGYINICENSEVIYTAHGSDVSGITRQFDWEVIGGSIIAVDNSILPNPVTTYIGTPFSGTDQTITIKWGTIGNAFLKVTETIFHNYFPLCSPKSKVVYLNIIETPIADFQMDQTYLGADICYNICLYHTVNFKDLSIGSNNSPIKFWKWDFGDNSPINSLQNPSHKYTTPGMYNVTLTVTNKCNCQSSNIRTICVSDQEAPNIFCPGVTCEGHKEIYHTDAVCDSYVWVVAGGTFNVLTDPAYIEVTWNNVGPDGFGYILLDGSYCQDVCDVITPVRVPVVLSNGTIDGPTDVCVDEYYTYKLPAWPATNYKWELSNNINGAIIYSPDENSYMVEILTGSNQGSFTLSCEYYNTISQPSCKGTAEITVDVKLKPEITGPGEICINSPCTCSVSNPPPTYGATDWYITHPNCTIFAVYNSNTSSIVFSANVFSTPGTYTIEASNPANFCDPEPYTLEVVDQPEAPTIIYGSGKVCLSYPYSYSTDVLKGAVTHWSVTGGTIQGSDIGNSVTVIWNTTTPKTITAWREWEHIDGCISDSIGRTINHIVVSGSINGSNTVCQDQTYSYNLDLDYGVIGETYNWKLYASGLNVGSISSGQGADHCSVTFLHPGYTISIPCTLLCEVTKCGIVETISLPITIDPYTMITSLTADYTTICSGESVTFDVSVSGSPANLFIWDFDDGTTPTPITAQVIHPFANTGNSDQIFTVSVQVESSCNSVLSSVETIDITVKPEPNAYVSPGGIIGYCPPMIPIDLWVTNTSTGSFTYQWWFDEMPLNGIGLPITGATGTNYTVISSPLPQTSDGDYWCVVTNTTTGCWKKTNKSLIIEVDCGTQCIPVGPAGINNFTVTLTGCGQAQATCNTLGTLGVNIIDFQWIVHSGAATVTSTGTESINNSKYYTFNKAGIYSIELNVYYENSDPNGEPCKVVEFGTIIIPLVAEMQWGLACNGNNDGYILTMEDFSSVFPGLPVTQWQWKLDGNNVGTSSSCTTASTTGTTQTIELIVSNGTAYPCTTSVQVDIPDLPVADYSTATTYDPPNEPFKSCEGREIEFTNNSTPANNIIFNVWDFKDGTESHMVHPKKEYFVNNNFAFDVLLTVTDKQGCQDDVTKTITVYNNNMVFDNPFPGNQYLPPSSELCFNSVLNPEIEPQFSGGSGILSFQWYLGTGKLPSTAQFTDLKLTGTPPASGAYWVEVTDENYCYKELNPVPAMVSLNYGPSAIIEGKQDVCAQEEFTLKAITGFPASYQYITYSWDCPAYGLLIPGDKIITLQLDAGVYTFELTVDDLNLPCPATSGPFTVTVHDLPPKPTIDVSPVNCNLYELKLQGYSNVTPTPAFNWSNGDCGDVSTIYHGGAYRLWITDEHGCRNFEDIDVPLEPSYYFWRFPRGCYYYCVQDLPKHIDGPQYIVFNNWIWYKDDIDIVYNNGNPASGSNSTCAPLAIALPTVGDGPGEYSWELDNGLCSQVSDIMVWDTVDCCEVELTLFDCTCSDNLFIFSLLVDQDECDNPTFNLAITDDNGIAITSVTIINVSPGTPMTIDGSFILNPPFPSTITFEIQVYCSQYPCSGKLTVPLSSCNNTKSVIQNSGKGENFEDKKIEKAGLEIIPNPAMSQTNIHYSFGETGDLVTEKRVIKIFDPMGRPVKTIEINDMQGVYILDLNKYSPGIYFVELNSNNYRLLTRRMIVYH